MRLLLEVQPKRSMKLLLANDVSHGGKRPLSFCVALTLVQFARAAASERRQPTELLTMRTGKAAAVVLDHHRRVRAARTAEQHRTLTWLIGGRCNHDDHDDAEF